MTDTATSRPEAPAASTRDRAPLIGLVVAVGLAALAMAVPPLTGWYVHVDAFPPLHASWAPRVGPGTLPALLLAGLAAVWAVPLAARLSWGRLLAASYAAGVAWLFALAFVDGPSGIGHILDTSYEYLHTARTTTNLHATLQEYVSRIPLHSAHHWPVHIAGHPPGALTFFVVLVRLGLGSGFAAGVVVTLVAASTAVGVLVTLRVLGAEMMARRAAPFLVLGPFAVWQAVSADAMFAAVTAWGMCALALAAVRRRTGWAVLAGLLLGYAVMLSYGLPVLGVLAVAVLFLAGSWRPLPVAVVAALAVVLAYAAFGFAWWQAYPVLVDRYWAGVASRRQAAYWMWGDLAALVFSAGPLLGAGLATWGHGLRERVTDRGVRVVQVLTGAGVVMVLLADLSQMSRAEVERIWLPFEPWLLLSCALLPLRWRRAGLVVQLVTALLVQHLFSTGW
jgi:hypothetical protein